MEKKKKRRTAMVVSDKMDKTVVVETNRMTRHPLYKKYIRKRIRLKAHDETNSCRTGDRVLVQESRPLSKDKRWKVVSIVEKAI